MGTVMQPDVRPERRSVLGTEPGVVVTRNLSRSYRNGEVEVKALRDVTAEVREGTLTCFVGPSGSGKTTLLNLIGCLDKPTSGELQVAGLDVTRFTRYEAAAFRGETIGFVFQSFNLIPVLSVFENVEYPLVMVQSRPAGERRARVLELLDAMGMADQHAKFPEQLSGGQKQRVAIARALVSRPRLVLADEPTANLDHANAALIIRLMKQIKDDLKTTFVFSTHDTRIIGEADVICRLEDGALTGCEVAHA